MFSLRPAAGTTSLRKSHQPIQSVELVMPKDEVMALPHGIRDRGLPVCMSKRLGPALKPV
jgi:hypothetical protein